MKSHPYKIWARESASNTAILTDHPSFLVLKLMPFNNLHHFFSPLRFSLFNLTSLISLIYRNAEIHLRVAFKSDVHSTYIYTKYYKTTVVVVVVMCRMRMWMRGIKAITTTKIVKRWRRNKNYKKLKTVDA